jgi:hypothetical protein
MGKECRIKRGEAEEKNEGEKRGKRRKTAVLPSVHDLDLLLLLPSLPEE